MQKNKIFVLVLVLIWGLIFSGCGFIRKIIKKKEKPALPKMLVLAFQCKNKEISEKMTKAFIQNLDKKIEVLDEKQFELQLATRPISMEDYFPVGSPPVYQKLLKDILKKEEVRTKFYYEGGIEYFLRAEAKEKKWGELEAGHVLTAETAELKLVEVKTGNVLLESAFTQGRFEIVAPERIGSKFAAKVNKKLTQIKKEIRKQEKARRKRLLRY